MFGAMLRDLCALSHFIGQFIQTSTHSFDYYLWHPSDVVDTEEALESGGKANNHSTCFMQSVAIRERQATHRQSQGTGHHFYEKCKVSGHSQRDRPPR